MTNLTEKSDCSLEFTADGSTWHALPFKTACRAKEDHPAFQARYPALQAYTLKMSDHPAWGGVITGLRLRFAADRGEVAVKSVTIYQ